MHKASALCHNILARKRANEYMKKMSLFGLFITLSAVSLTACKGNEKPIYVLNVSTYDMHFKNQVIGTTFDPTGLRVMLAGVNCKCMQILQPDEYTITAPEIIEGDTWEAVVHVDGYDDYTISGETRDKVKVACIGDSLTYGHVWQNEAYPVYLQEYLGSDRFTIRNFGINGVSITGYGGSWDNPNQRYALKQEYQDSKDFQPDVIVMCLGTNDGTNWSSAEATFEPYYYDLVGGYRTALPNAQWVFMVSPPCGEPNAYNINNEAMREHVNPVQRKIAQMYGFEMIDLREEFENMEDGFTSMLRPTWNGQPDLVHFSKEGAQYVANRVKETIDSFQF